MKQKPPKKDKGFKVLFLEWNIGCWAPFLVPQSELNSRTSAIEAFVSRLFQLRDTSREQNISSKHAPQIESGIEILECFE